MMRSLAIVSGLLVLSAGANLYQWRDNALDKAACASDREREIAVAVEQGRTLAAQESASRASLIATLAQADNRALLTELAGIAERSRQRVTVYLERVRELPAPRCAPGAERMRLWNGVLAEAPIP